MLASAGKYNSVDYMILRKGVKPISARYKNNFTNNDKLQKHFLGRDNENKKVY